MRSAEPALVMLSLALPNRKYHGNRVAYPFWHSYRINFVNINFFSDYIQPNYQFLKHMNVSSEAMFATFEVHHEIAPLEEE